jgi:voltage-gated potassium channel
LNEFGRGIWLTLPLLLSLGVIITALGQIVGRREGWRPFESFYWAFVTGTTVGYGDLRPTHKSSRIIAIVVALTGLTFTGILIALAVYAAIEALKAYGVNG